MTTPVYDPGVPERPSDALATTQPEILANFLALYNAFLINHNPISGTGQGQHTIIELVEQLGPAQTGTTEIAIYSKKVDEQTDQVFLRYRNNGQEVQLTNYQLYSLIQPPNQTCFFTILPGKLIVYFGSFTSLPNDTLILNPPVCKNIAGMTITPIGATPRYKPNVVLLIPNDGEVQGIIFKPAEINEIGGAVPPCSYIIVGNL